MLPKGEMSVITWLLSPSLTFLLLVCLNSLATSHGFPAFYFPPRCADVYVEHREHYADAVFSGLVKVKKYEENATYTCTINLYRVMKGKEILNHWMNSSGVSHFYKIPVQIHGFGNRHICDSDVDIGDIRIFLVTLDGNGSLWLNSSLVRIGLRTLRLPHAQTTTAAPAKEAEPISTSVCKYFYCSFYADCRLGPLTGDPYCVCPNCDNEPSEPVCATDGNFYNNPCEIRKESCKRRKRIKATLASFCPENKNPCKNMQCMYGAICRASIDGLSARCECPEHCDSYGDSVENQPVCGMDNRDYRNSCELRRAACVQMGTIGIKHIGKCDPCQGVICPQYKSCIADEFYQPVCQCNNECAPSKTPVCGTDNRSYDSECLLRSAACRSHNSTIAVAYIGECRYDENPCEQVVCSYHATCSVSANGEASCRCPDRCPVNESVVCGSDNVTYRNLCFLERKACETRKNITAIASIPCYNDTCLNFPCPHSSVCEVIDGNPTCVCPTCSAVIDPVCGSDGLTYQSECHMLLENCQRKGHEVQVMQRGPCSVCKDLRCEFGVCHNVNGTGVCRCPEDACVKTNLPVCGDDGITYMNLCNLTVESCKQRKEIRSVSDGPCEPLLSVCNPPCAFGAVCVENKCRCEDILCPSTPSPICGSNGKTYNSECLLNKEACQRGLSILIKHQGQCQEKHDGSGTGDDEDDDGDDGDFSGGKDDLIFESTSAPDPLFCNINTNCRFNGQCDYSVGGYGKCVCKIDFCTKDDVVCGSDGQFYRHVCALRTAACEQQTNITVREPEVCLDNGGDPPCGENATPLVDPSTSKPYNCTSCMADPGSCNICPRDSFCILAKCCPKVSATEPACMKTEFRCCPDLLTPAPGPDYRGCPYTCQCNPLGSNRETCDPVDFQCDCKPGVAGKSCNACQPGWWGLRKIAEGNSGCLPCQCSPLGSVREDCEQNTGRCLCKPYASGHKCDHCEEEGHILTAEGCTPPPTQSTVARSCGSMVCELGQCVIDKVSNLPRCSCDFDCPNTTSYVCGTDGETYRTGCHLQQKACREKSGVRVKAEGECNAGGLLSWFGFGNPRYFMADEPNHQRTSSLPGTAKVQPAFEVTTDLLETAATAAPDWPVTCADRPCNNGATCLDRGHLGFLCLCTVFWRGPKCDILNDFSVPHFSGNSYIKLVGWRDPKEVFDLRLTIIVLNETGLLLYAGQLSGKGDFFSLVISNGYIEFRFDNGHGAAMLRSKQPLLLNKQHYIGLKRNGTQGQLEVEGQQTVTGRSEGSLTSLNVERELYLGHLSVYGGITLLPKRVLKNTGGVTSGFIGCITSLHDAASNTNFELMGPRHYDQSMILEGRSIGQCTSDPCYEVPCKNGGLCRMLDTFNYECTCIGSFSGADCTERRKKTRHLNSKDPYVMETPRFSGDNYIRYKATSELEYNLTIELVFSSRSADGVLLFASQSPDGSGDFLLLMLQDGFLVFLFNFGQKVNTLRFPDVVALKDWHRVTLSRSGKNVSLSVDDGLPVSSVAQGDMQYLNIDGYIYIGAIPQSVVHAKSYLHARGLQGVIQRVSVNSEDLGDMFESADLVYGAKVYHGPPCHPNPCQAGQVCLAILDSYRCEKLRMR